MIESQENRFYCSKAVGIREEVLPYLESKDFFDFLRNSDISMKNILRWMDLKPEDATSTLFILEISRSILHNVISFSLDDSRIEKKTNEALNLVLFVNRLIREVVNA